MVNPRPNAFITASVVLSVGFPFSLKERHRCFQHCGESTIYREATRKARTGFVTIRPSNSIF
ncbi:MAG TPA: hypothetical protein DDY57_16440 [Franconibacter pulveris]|nr:hypothetical protein [Franconibacter pulveris]